MSQRITYLGEDIRPRSYQRDTRGRFSLRRSIAKFFAAVLVWVKRLLIAALIGSIAFGIYYVGTLDAQTISTTNVVQVAPLQNFPILHKIALAESGDSQVGRDGQVVVHVNKDGSYDIGRYQINSTWNALATKMGYNLFVEKDNEAFARYLFENYGSEPWSSSKGTWDK